MFKSTPMCDSDVFFYTFLKNFNTEKNVMFKKKSHFLVVFAKLNSKLRVTLHCVL